MSDLWLIRTWRKSYPGGRTHLPGWRSTRDQFMPASGSGATHPIRIRLYNKERQQRIESRSVHHGNLLGDGDETDRCSVKRVYVTRLGKLQGGPKRPVFTRPPAAVPPSISCCDDSGRLQRLCSGFGWPGVIVRKIGASPTRSQCASRTKP